jgi:GTPase involved in cell partitioning and DNA repair
MKKEKMDKGEFVERLGFFFVCDNTDPGTLDEIKVIIEKMNLIEKTSSLKYEKCIIVNKMDKKVDKSITKAMNLTLEGLKKKYKITVYKVSALTNHGVKDALRNFITKIHQNAVDVKQNEGIDDQDLDQDDENMVKY